MRSADSYLYRLNGNPMISISSPTPSLYPLPSLPHFLSSPLRQTQFTATSKVILPTTSPQHQNDLSPTCHFEKYSVDLSSTTLDNSLYPVKFASASQFISHPTSATSSNTAATTSSPIYLNFSPDFLTHQSSSPASVSSATLDSLSPATSTHLSNPLSSSQFPSRKHQNISTCYSPLLVSSTIPSATSSAALTPTLSPWTKPSSVPKLDQSTPSRSSLFSHLSDFSHLSSYATTLPTSAPSVHPSCIAASSTASPPCQNPDYTLEFSSLDSTTSTTATTITTTTSTLSPCPKSITHLTSSWSSPPPSSLSTDPHLMSMNSDPTVDPFNSFTQVTDTAKKSSSLNCLSGSINYPTTFALDLFPPYTTVSSPSSDVQVPITNYEPVSSSLSNHLHPDLAYTSDINASCSTSSISHLHPTSGITASSFNAKRKVRHSLSHDKPNSTTQIFLPHPDPLLYPSPLTTKRRTGGSCRTARTSHTFQSSPVVSESLNIPHTSTAGNPSIKSSSREIPRSSNNSSANLTLRCTYDGCSQVFSNHQTLAHHKREVHQKHPSAITPGLGSGLTPAQLSARNSFIGPHVCTLINPSTKKPCNLLFTRPYDLTRHEDTIHNSRKQKVRCLYCTHDKTFSRSDALTRHMRVVHPQVEFPGKLRRRRAPKPSLTPASAAA